MKVRKSEQATKVEFVQVELNPDLKKRVKMACAAEGITVITLVTKLLTDYIETNMSDTPTKTKN